MGCISKKRRGFKFDTTTKEVIDVVELVAIAAGHGCLISEVEDNRKEHFLKTYTAHINTDCTVVGNHEGYVH